MTNSFISPYDRKPPEETKVLVAMSGGVDSSVAAALLKSQGYQVIGIHLQLWDHGSANQERFSSRCCSLIDSNDARRVCDRLDIPFYIINAQDVFKAKVVDYFVHEYLQTRTPNPCVQCNNAVKFDYLMDRAKELDCDFVATGHYAQVRFDPDTGLAQLVRAIDPKKDQSYFLFGMSQESLQKTMMPIGGLSKDHVRKLGLQFGLNQISNKPDSQEICFIGAEGYQEFIERRTTPELRREGIIRTSAGATVGRHKGLFRYTIGQRKGLQLNQKDDKRAYYVVGFDTNTDALIVGDESELFQKEVTASRMNWLAPMDLLRPFECQAKIRAHHEPAQCLVTCFENDTIYVEFKETQRAITPGQTIVFYQKNQVLGGGFIERAGTEVNPIDLHAEDTRVQSQSL